MSNPLLTLSDFFEDIRYIYEEIWPALLPSLIQNPHQVSWINKIHPWIVELQEAPASALDPTKLRSAIEASRMFVLTEMVFTFDSATETFECDASGILIVAINLWHCIKQLAQDYCGTDGAVILLLDKAAFFAGMDYLKQEARR